MKDWVFGRRFMEEQPDNGGEGGGGGGEPTQTTDNGGAGDPDDPGKGEEEGANAVGEELNKEGEPKPDDKPTARRPCSATETPNAINRRVMAPSPRPENSPFQHRRPSARRAVPRPRPARRDGRPK